MRHLTLQQLSATVDQALSGVSLELVRRHLEECEECRARGSKLARVDGVVAQLVSHDPGDAWLEAVAIEIEERVRAEVTGRFDAPEHPAGPPPLEFAGAPPALTAEELDRIWEEGSTTPRPSSVKPREAGEAALAPSELASALPPVARPAPAEIAPVANVAPAPSAPARPAPIEKSVVVVKPTPAVKVPPLANLAKPVPVAKAVAPPAPAPKIAKPPAVVPPSPVVKPAPAPAAKAVSAPAAKPAPAPAAKREANEVLATAKSVRVPPPPRGVPDREPPVRWGRHADRIVRARREASSAQRETLVPLAFGLVGGALAGAFVVTLFFLRHGSSGTAPAAPVVHETRAPEPAAAVVDPVTRPAIEPVPAAATPQVDPAPVEAPRATAPPPSASLTPRMSTPAAAVPPPAAKSRATAPPRTAHATGAAAARAIPTGEESWPLLCGEVVDESGAPVTGARILLADLDVGARTDRRGRFCLAAPPGDRTLSVVALGFTTQRRAVTVAAGAADLHVVLKAVP